MVFEQKINASDKGAFFVLLKILFKYVSILEYKGVIIWKTSLTKDN